MPQPLDAEAVGRWCRLALDGLGQAREAIDAINVYPVADQDTGTNLYLTVESAAQAVAAAEAGSLPDSGTGGGGLTLAEAVRTMAHGALIGARGNSGTILAQVLRGVSDVLAPAPTPVTGHTLHEALRRAGTAAYEAVARPVEGTMLTVVAAAATAAGQAADDGGRPPAVAAAAAAGARAALARTPAQLPALARAGVVDAGGSGLVTVLDALDAALSGGAPATARGRPRATVPTGRDPHCRAAEEADSGPAPDITPDQGPVAGTEQDAGPPAGTPPEPRADGPTEPARPCAVPPGTASGTDQAPGPSHEVTYLLDAVDTVLPPLRRRLDTLGDSLVVVGGDGLWHVHLHTDDPGAAVEAGIEAGRPHRVRITHLGAPAAPPDRADRAVLVLVPGDGLAGLCREAGAVPVPTRGGEPPGSGELAAAIRGAHAREVVLLPNDDRLRHAAAAAAEAARGRGVRVAVVPTRSPVQGIAALAVHAPDRRFDEDVVAMTAAARATRFGELTRAEQRAWTSAGICQPGDVLGMIDGDVAVIGSAHGEVATEVLDRMLSGGGELVTLVTGATAPPDLGRALEEWLRRTHLGVDTVVCAGQQETPLLVGVE